MIFQFSSDHVFLVFEFWVCSHDPSLVLVVGQMILQFCVQNASESVQRYLMIFAIVEPDIIFLKNK